MSFSLRVYQLDNDNVGGLHHFCFAVETIDEVDQCISRLKDSEATIIELPRFSGLGDYVATILDPDGNRIEIIKKFQ
jgi:lactoylglutathione lyase